MLNRNFVSPLGSGEGRYPDAQPCDTISQSV